ncbi:MAG: FecR family protein [Pseudomonas sp.]|uniref:FecR domain-containing protein n=1 Tax=Pseudomonas sp. TaxID=306 RepID=UPI00339104E5
MSPARLDDAAEQAIAWLVRLRSGGLSAHQQQRFEHWRSSDPAHEAAWARLQQSLGAHEILRQAPGLARETLLQPDLSRRALVRGLAAVGLVGGGLWLAGGTTAPRTWLADLRTGGGERRSWRLADGSRLSLNADSAVDLDFSGDQRLLRLRRGALLVQVAADPTRPFIVVTEQGQVRALGTRFLVEQLPDSSRVVVLEHAVRASLPEGATLELRQGQAALLHPGRIEALSDPQHYRADWLQGRLSVLDESLASVIDALRPYQSGLIRLSPAVRQLRVQGVFPLDDPRLALTALAETLPIQVRHYGPWLTLITPAE